MAETTTRWRKKPVEIEARRCDRSTTPEALAAWCGGRSGPHPTRRGCGEPMVVFIETLEGTMLAEPGDWIIRGVKGEFYPCKPDVFEATYEPADQPPPAGEGRTPREWTIAPSMLVSGPILSADEDPVVVRELLPSSPDEAPRDRSARMVRRLHEELRDAIDNEVTERGAKELAIRAAHAAVDRVLAELASSPDEGERALTEVEREQVEQWARSLNDDWAAGPQGARWEALDESERDHWRAMARLNLLGSAPPSAAPVEEGAREALTDDELARVFHNTYERLAPEFGYRTREESAKPWVDVPMQNRMLMVATVREVRAHLAASRPAPVEDGEREALVIRFEPLPDGPVDAGGERPTGRVEATLLLAQETLILEATEALCALMEREGVDRPTLVARMGTSTNILSALFAGEHGFGLGDLAHVAAALGYRPSINLFDQAPIALEAR